jgi:hypothetical protein
MSQRLRETAGGPFVVASAALVAGVSALLALPGADSLWLVAFGRAVVHGHGFSDAVPYAPAPTHAWGNVPAASEILFWALHGIGGTTALAAANVAAVFVGFTVLGRTMRASGAEQGGAALALLLVAAGSLGALVVIRAQLFSIAAFPLLLALLYSETQRPSRRVWLLLPLLAVWSSLHGAVLAGAFVAGTWLVLERARRRPRQAVAVLVLVPFAICATPALAQTPRYYADVLGNVAARRSFGLWAPVSFDVLGVALVVAALVLGVLALRARPALWELVALAGLALLAARSARGGVWLLMLAAVPAARQVPLPRLEVRSRVAVAMVGVAAILAIVGLADAGSRARPGSRVVERAIVLSREAPILAEPFLAERVAAGGGRVWIANPIDAFATRAQAGWIDWLQGRKDGARYLAQHGRYVLVRPKSKVDLALLRLRAYRRVAADRAAVLYARLPAGRGS